MKRFKRLIVVFPLILALVVSGCGSSSAPEKKSIEKEKHIGAEKNEEESDGPTAGLERIESGESVVQMVKSLSRPSFLKDVSSNVDSGLVPSVAPYQLTDTNQLMNADRYKYYLDNSSWAGKLKENLFVISDSAGMEFFEVYESNRYNQMPSFVTVDSLMHTYHLYFAYLLKRTEKNYLSSELLTLSNKMMEESVEQYNLLTDDEWKQAAKVNAAFFGVAARLQDESTPVPGPIEDVVNEEVSKIMAASDISTCSLTGGNMDYTQFIPRGYYESSEVLKKYFRAMMWYGQVTFYENDDQLNRCAALMTAALTGERLELWEGIYTVTAFFAGASDDLSYYDYEPALEAAFGSATDVESFVDGDYGVFKSITDGMRAPVINSIPMGVDTEGMDVKEENKGFRFMGQRFSIDAAIFEALTNDAGKNAEGSIRPLPDTLDVPAAIGSETAHDILKTEGVTEYEHYESNLAKLREGLESNDELWNASLYSSWLNTLRPILDENKDGYPSFMTNAAWKTKAVESFAGSYTELKHDTVLYAKQVMVEMGGGDMPTYDDRGYVEPEVEVWSRFINLSDKTREGLDSLGYLEESDRENLSRLTEMAKILLTISEKELREETLSDDEYEFIRSYGGSIEHFWLETIKDEATTPYPKSRDFPAALITDIASNANGECLEIATGNPSKIYVVAPVAGTLRICSGSVFSFYQFTQPSSQRMTDTQWREMMGIEMNSSGGYNQGSRVDKPEWTKGYRVDTY